MFAAESSGYLVGCPGLVLKEKSEFLQIGIGMSSIQLPLLVEGFRDSHSRASKKSSLSVGKSGKALPS